MDIHEWKNNNESEQQAEPQEQTATKNRFLNAPLNIDTIKNFFGFTGGSLFYCISAVFVAYGIVNLMGPVLSEGKAFMTALPCIITLHAYELALLVVLVLIVSRKVVDDAVSVVIFIALFLIGTSMALGTVADKNTTMSFWFGLIGIALAFGKFFALWRFVRIQFKTLSIIGLGGIITYNYLSPTLLARSIVNDPAQEPIRRNLWLFLTVAMMIATVFVLIEAMRRKSPRQTQQNDKTAFLQKPVMVYIFALILIIVSGVHQYAMSFTYVLERVIGDYVPVTLIAVLVLIEILRHLGRKIGIIELAISCIPLALTMLAIWQKSFIPIGPLGIDLIFYPPVILALSGLALAAMALYHRWYMLLYVPVLYGLGVILTIGYSPAYPYDLNIYSCFGMLIIGLLIYGAIKRNQYVCVSAVVIFCLGLAKWNGLPDFASSYQLKQLGVLAGICGMGIMVLYLLFSSELHKTIRIVGALCLVGFIFDYLPEYTHWKYVVVLAATGLLMAGLWFRTRDILVMSTLLVPMGIRVYMLAKQIAHWRFVILGFFLLIAGTAVSLLKRPARNQISIQESQQSPDTST